MRRRTGGFLALCLALTVAWWAIAFRQDNRLPPPQISEEAVSLSPEFISLRDSLSAWKRSDLLEALAGNAQMQTRLIKGWDQDAVRLASSDVSRVERLAGGEIAEAGELGRVLTTGTDEELEQLRNRYRRGGHSASAALKRPRFVAQTYASADLLLSMVDSDQIVAIPRGIRKKNGLHPLEVTDKIPLNADRTDSERIFLAKPDIAFVAPYSQPSTVEVLRRQGISLFTLSDVKEIDRLIEEIAMLGQIIDRPAKGRLMQIFLQAAVLNIDNQASFIQQKHGNWPDHLLYLYVLSGLSTPGPDTLIFSLMKRLGVEKVTAYRISSSSGGSWKIPITMEEISALDPDGIVLCTSKEDGETRVNQLLTEPALENVAARRRRQVIAVDEEVQTSPSQYAVLAYYDLFQAAAQVATTTGQ
jgi:iron complex transport system substrate-binding protein